MSDEHFQVLNAKINAVAEALGTVLQVQALVFNRPVGSSEEKAGSMVLLACTSAMLRLTRQCFGQDAYAEVVKSLAKSLNISPEEVERGKN